MPEEGVGKKKIEKRRDKIIIIITTVIINDRRTPQTHILPNKSIRVPKLNYC